MREQQLHIHRATPSYENRQALQPLRVYVVGVGVVD